MTLPEISYLDDTELVVRLKGGDIDALDAIYHRHAASLLRLAYRLTRSVDDAEDVVQDVFVGLPLAMRRYVDRGKLEAWLRTITTRVALNRLRRHGRRREVPLDGETEVPRVGAADTEVGRLVLGEALGALPDDLRAVFVLREIEGYSHAEIGEMLGIRRGTSEVRLFRAIRQLRRLLRNAE